MDERKFEVVFTGKLAEGFDGARVLANLSTLMKADAAKVKGIFRGAGAVVTAVADRERAEAVAARIREAGALCTVREVAPPEPADSTPVGEVPDEEPLQLLRRPDPPSAPADPPLPPLSRPPEPPAAPVPPAPAGLPPLVSVVAPPEKSGLFSMVVKLVLVAALAWGGWEVYQRFFAPPTPAFKAYTAFADAMAREEYGKAAELSIGEAQGKAEMITQMMAPTEMKVYGRSISMNKPTIKEIAGEVTWIKRKKHAEKKADSGAVHLDVTQTVCRIPPGVSSALCKWPVSFHHEVVVRMVEGDVWKVAEFKEERVEEGK